MRVGIDGSNLRQGGGITHLVQLIAAADPAASGIGRVIVWGSKELLAQLPRRPWLNGAQDRALNGGALARAFWQQRILVRRASASVDVLFVPGGTYLGGFRPYVTMFQNMLPFATGERRRYGWSRMRLKLELLRRTQRATFVRANGVIFLTEHARAAVADAGVRISGAQRVIPHGLDSRFFGADPSTRAHVTFSTSRPFRWLYVSAIHAYKRPWNVVEATAELRGDGLPVSLDIVGPPYGPAYRRLMGAVKRLDPHGGFVRVTPGVPHAELPSIYAGADGFVFASTCENMPLSLLEAMAAGLPIACSDRPPMPELLKDGGIYFDPERPSAIAAAMRRLMVDEMTRTEFGRIGQAAARPYSWSRCAHDTFEFLAEFGRS
jgi:glycosyltransferase involved in cell wall biosynthesis